ncbi:MAG: formylglycine-generating enzyme family protein [Planctomycetaceae bacterium]|nr:formylglycine-generating enzyme family protein [Planctomycetaceae bacterium]
MLRFTSVAVTALVVHLVAVTLAGEQPVKPTAKPTKAELLKRFSDEFVEIAPGEKSRDGSITFPSKFRMGSDQAASEKPAHEVTIKHRFAIAKYEVPQNLYEAVMGANPSKWKGPRNSVEMFSWQEARDFCGKITELLRAEKLLGEDEAIRLPTEAEWEYCCRAGTSTVYSFGDSATKDGDAGNKASVLDEFGWHTGNAAGNDPPVGAKKPNAWGLYDFHGYLWEFVEDSWHDNYDGAPTDGRAWTDAAPKKIVVRSGSWKDHYSKLSSSARKSLPLTEGDDAIGFRCVKAKK